MAQILFAIPILSSKAGFDSLLYCVSISDRGFKYFGEDQFAVEFFFAHIDFIESNFIEIRFNNPNGWIES